MGKSKGYTPPVFQPKELTVGDIEKGIKKLERRRSEIMALSSARFDDQEVDNAVSNLVGTISDVFGENSRELDEHRYMNIWKGPRFVDMDPYDKQASFQAGIPDATRLVDGLISRLKELGEDLKGEEGHESLMVLKGFPIHKRIHNACLGLYEDGHYASSVFEASKVLVAMVKEKSGRSDKDGSALMFAELVSKEPGILFNAFSSQSEVDEQSGLGYLFAGAVLAIRNPRGHDLWIDSPEQALEYIIFLSMLAKKLDSAVKR